jgi:tRNA(Leu) C34 or U34 (ribose-2'-O)-methylase TrmL
MNREINLRGYAAIGLDNPKSKVNVGSVLRAAGVYDASLVIASKNRWGKSSTDTMGTHKHIPFISGVEDLHDYIPVDCVPVAVDLVEGATPLNEFNHPERAFYIFGAEDATLGDRVLKYCKHTVYVPTNGCMNLAATVNVILYDRLSKQLNRNKGF